MKPTISNLAAYLRTNENQLANTIVESVLHKMNLTIPQEEVERAVTMYEALVNFLSMSVETEEKGLPSELIDWSKQNAFELVSANGNISDIIVRYPPTREVFTDLVAEWSNRFELSREEYTSVLKKINCMLDVSLKETVVAFEEYNTRLKEEFIDEIDHISFPIVPLTKDMAVIPLVGNIDEHRTNHLIETVLPKVNDLKINYLIVDFSGVCNIDELAVRSLDSAGSMLRLLGIKVISTGISPNLAKTAVAIGVDTMNINYFQSVRQALENLKS
ncbi:STAS domain-containing protein [Bacillus sp. SCS-153A]|uniref:STAS domain-containing protein n=1 Tax=Rossellomorea sedimentorum TaxID=3115294 RepID=UPI0039065558